MFDKWDLVNGQTIVDQIRILTGQINRYQAWYPRNHDVAQCERNSGADEQMTDTASGEASALEPLADQ